MRYNHKLLRYRSNRSFQLQRHDNFDLKMSALCVPFRTALQLSAYPYLLSVGFTPSSAIHKCQRVGHFRSPTISIRVTVMNPIFCLRFNISNIFQRLLFKTMFKRNLFHEHESTSHVSLCCSILGMNLFGCKFCETMKGSSDVECDRKNFDSLLWAIVTVFQVPIGSFTSRGLPSLSFNFYFTFFFILTYPYKKQLCMSNICVILSYIYVTYMCQF